MDPTRCKRCGEPLNEHFFVEAKQGAAPVTLILCPTATYEPVRARKEKNGQDKTPGVAP